MSLFKNIVAYTIGPDWIAPQLADLLPVLEKGAFVPCGPTDEQTAGWQPPRGEENAALAELIAGQLILKIAVERKAVPGAAVKAELEVRCKAIEAATGRKPGRNEKKEIKEEIIKDFLPRAFSKRSAHTIWVDIAKRMLVVGAGSHKSADNVVNHIVEVMANAGHILPISPLQTAMSPSAAMSEWLTTQEAPVGFAIDRDLELKDPERATVRYARHTLELVEIVQHIKEGKIPTQLAMTWEGQVSFMLTEGFSIKKINILDVETDVGEQDSGFDADVAIATGMLTKLIPDLVNVLGGIPQEAGSAVADSSANDLT